MSNPIQLLDVVALTDDLPQRGLIYVDANLLLGVVDEFSEEILRDRASHCVAKLLGLIGSKFDVWDDDVGHPAEEIDDVFC